MADYDCEEVVARFEEEPDVFCPLEHQDRAGDVMRYAHCTKENQEDLGDKMSRAWSIIKDVCS